MKSTIIQSIVAAAFLGLTYTGHAQYTSTSRDVLTPNTGIAPAGGVTLNGTTFINRGLQGVGRVAANSTQTLDAGITETLGSISDMQITNWAPTGGGNYSGTFNFLPDRGYNSGSTFSNYAARINTFDFTFTPYTSSATTAAQNQIAMTYTGATRFSYDADPTAGTDLRFTTGLVVTGASSVLSASVPVPVVTGSTTIGGDGGLTNRLTLDTEGLILDHRAGKAGSGWVGDEYGAHVYHFNSSKTIDGVLTLPPALVPRDGNGVNFAANTTGRRSNQGMEGIAISPDGTRLFALLQSATLQDSASGQQTRDNTRLVIYDISTTDTPTDPIEQYVIQLPRIDDDGGSQAVRRTGAQSALLALDNTQLLILSRDGLGRGTTGLGPVFKSVLLADIAGAENIDGLYDAAGAAIAPGGVPLTGASAIDPVAWTEALNMIGKVDLGITELEQFGLNLNGAATSDANSISEKWEALALVSAFDPLAPDDYFLFVGNDNDFITQTGSLVQANGTTVGYNAGLENDTMVLAYRVTIVPEPGSLAMLGCAAVGLLGFRRRRQG